MTIISFKHRFIFVKTHKTAGTSLEVHLSQFCDENDIVTPIFPINEQHKPRNYDYGGYDYFNHMPAMDIRKSISEDYNSFFSFCFERHPIDKCISFFAMLKNSKHHHDENNPKTWGEYVERGEFPVDTQSYTDGRGNLIVDKIYRYEEMSASLEDISLRLKIPHTPMLSREKSGFRVGVPTFEEVINNSSQRNRILDAFESSLMFTPYK